MRAIQTTIINGLILIGLLFTTNSMAIANAENSSAQAPDEMLKKATLKMIRSINSHRGEIKQSPDKMKSLVEQIILPHLDFIAASKMVMGKYWRRAEKQQKINFIRQFRLLLLRFYSSALSEYMVGRDKALSEDLFHYFPIKLNDGDSTITVRAELISDKGNNIPIHYRMHLTKKGWKIYDVSVEGVSMITTYKNNFATQFKNEGIDALIASLEEKNKNLLANNNKK